MLAQLKLLLERPLLLQQKEWEKLFNTQLMLLKRLTQNTKLETLAVTASSTMLLKQKVDTLHVQ